MIAKTLIKLAVGAGISKLVADAMAPGDADAGTETVPSTRTRAPRKKAMAARTAAARKKSAPGKSAGGKTAAKSASPRKATARKSSSKTPARTRSGAARKS